MQAAAPDFIQQHFWIFFLVMWLIASTMLSFLSGWFALMKRYPNKLERADAVFGFEGGRLGGISFRGILTLTVCPSGLRVGVWRLFGPFCRPFLVPWNEVSVAATKTFFMKATELRFGSPEAGRLVVRESLAQKLAQAAGSRWPAAQAV
jgi:hypothetical protein